MTKVHDCPDCTCELSDPSINAEGARHRNASDTERAAAWAVLPRSGSQRMKVLAAFAENWSTGLTDVEVASVTGMHFQSSQPRRHELMKGGWVVDSGERRPTGKGGTAIVWRLSDKALEEL